MGAGMNGYQFFTLLTLATATFLGLGGVFFAYLIVTGSPRLASYGVPPIAEDSRVLVAILVALGGFFAAGTAVKAQQTVVGFMLEREQQRLRTTFREVEEALGTEAAHAWLRVRLAKYQGQLERAPWLARLFG